MSNTTQKIPRPLSPHLQVYKLPLTALMSVSHRASGAALAVGTILVMLFLLAAATGEAEYNMVMALATSTLGTVILFLWSFALYFHMCNGIRHMFWDIGKNFDKASANRSNYYVIFSAISVTILTWVLACGCLAN